MSERYFDEERVRKGRTILWIAMLGSIVLIPALNSNKLTVVFFISWVASFFGGIGGIREVARGTGGSGILMLGAMVLVFMPVVNIIVIAAYLVIAHGALRREAEPAPRVAAKAATPKPGARSSSVAGPSAAARSAAPAVHAGRAHGLSGVIAQIKQAGLRNTQGGEFPDGTRLGVEMKLPDGSPMRPEDVPLMCVVQGFGVVYLVDEGSHYSWATVGQLAKAGLSLDEVHRIGVENLKRETRNLAVAEGESAYMLTMGGQFEASLLLVDSLWERGGVLAGYAPNGAVASIPARDLCVFCDARSEVGLRRVRTFAMTASVAVQSHALTRKVYVRSRGRWREDAAGKPDKPREDLPPLEFK